MNFNVFMDLYNKDADRNGLCDSLEYCEYIPLEEKDRRAQIIIDETYRDENGCFMLNSVLKHMLTFLMIVDMYTNIEIDFNDGLFQYNALDESGALDLIIAKINRKDLNEFKVILDMKCEDVVVNEYGVHKCLSELIKIFKKYTDKS